MALWGISTTQETWANSYAIPKYLNDQDRNNTPLNCFDDDRGWIYRRYATNEHSGMGTIYTDEVLIPVAGLNTVAAASTTFTTGIAITFGSDGANANPMTYTGIAPATPVSVFFEDPRESSGITVSSGGTTVIGPSSTGYIHVCWNENIFCSTGSTINIKTFDVNNENESTSIVGYAETSVGDIVVFNNTNGTAGGQHEVYNLTGKAGTDFAGQICNRVSFAFTAPSTLLTANSIFKTAQTNFPSGIGSTIFYFAESDLTGVTAGVSSVTIQTNAGVGKTNAPIVAVGSSSITIGSPGVTTAGFSTIRDQIVTGIGTTASFSNLTSQTVLKIDMDRGVVGTVTSFYPDDTAAIKTFINAGVATAPGAALPIGIDRQVGGAGTFMSGSFEPNGGGTIDGSGVVGLGTTALKVGIWATTF